jgi:DNA-binding SARP family transcriptional activator/tetratricopeptide (TPR) repeat protein
MFTVQSLGGVRIQDSSGDTIRLRSRKHVALLLYLAASGRRVHARDSLARLLWDTPIDRARHSLSQAIYDLRRNLPGVMGSATGDAVHLEPAAVRLDAAELEQALKSGELSLAMDLYRGPFAENLEQVGTDDFERWLDSERVRLARLGEMALRRYVRHCDEAGQWGEMCVAALRLVKLSALDEEAHRTLMRGLWLHGDAASALRHFDEVVKPLKRELPGGISRETHLLAERIRSTPAPEPWVDDLGEIQTPFLGREEEMESLRTAVRDVATSPVTGILISGEAGIGKSRLATEFVRSVSLENVRLLDSRCYPAEAEVPYGPVVDGLRPIAAEISRRSAVDLESFTRVGHLLPEFEHLTSDSGERVDPAAWRRRLYEEVTSLVRLAAEDQPIIWVIEDVQWMDATSTSLLHYMTRRLEGHPFLLVVTLRVAREAGLPDALPLSPPDVSELSSEVRLAPLGVEVIGQILERAAPGPGHEDSLQLAQRLAGGNPLFALEVFRAAVGSTEWAAEASRWDPLTDARLSKVLAVRLKGLSKTALKLLQATAVLERQATPGAVAAISGLSLPLAAEASSEPYGRGLIQDRDGHLDFVADIMREYVYAGMTALSRTALHLTAAEYLERSSDTNSATLARHYHLGENRPLTYKHSIQAAREAKAAAGQMEAAAMAGLAVSSSEGPQERLAALHLLAEAELESAQLPSAKEHLDEILRLDTEMSAEEKVAVKLKLVMATSGEANWEDASQILTEIERDLRLIESVPRRVESRLEVLNWRLKAASRVNDIAKADRIRARIARVQKYAQRTGRLSEAGTVTALSSLAAYELFYGSARKGLEQLNSLTISNTWPEHLVHRVRMLRGLGNQRMGRWDASEHELREAYTLAKKTNDTLQIATVLTNLACTAMERGAWDDALEYGRSASSLHRALSTALDVLIPLRLNAANLAFYQGRVREAFSLYADIHKQSIDFGYTEFKTEVEACLGLCALQLRDAPVARHWIAQCETHETALDGMQERFKVEWLWGYLHRQSDPHVVRERLLRVAVREDAVDRVGSLKLRWLAESLVQVPDKDAANELLKSVRQDLRDAGLSWFVYFADRWRRLADCCEV